MYNNLSPENRAFNEVTWKYIVDAGQPTDDIAWLQAGYLRLQKHTQNM
jgi:hypothetical protein